MSLALTFPKFANEWDTITPVTRGCLPDKGNGKKYRLSGYT